MAGDRDDMGDVDAAPGDEGVEPEEGAADGPDSEEGAAGGGAGAPKAGSWRRRRGEPAAGGEDGATCSFAKGNTSSSKYTCREVMTR